LATDVAAGSADVADVADVAAAGGVAGEWIAADPVGGGWATSWPQSYAIRAGLRWVRGLQLRIQLQLQL